MVYLVNSKGCVPSCQSFSKPPIFKRVVQREKGPFSVVLFVVVCFFPFILPSSGCPALPRWCDVCLAPCTSQQWELRTRYLLRARNWGRADPSLGHLWQVLRLQVPHTMANSDLAPWGRKLPRRQSVAIPPFEREFVQTTADDETTALFFKFLRHS